MKLLHRKVLSTIIAFAVAINYCTLTSFAKETDGNWVENKDNWRHGITDDSGGDTDEGDKGEEFKKGDATGEYAVKLSDGNYFWYHQVSGGDGCKYCGDWSAMVWGSGGTFGADGCAIYSTSLIVSNLYGEAITPHKWLEDIGCKISGNKCDTGPSACLDDHALSAYSNILGVMKSKYNVEPCTDDLLGKSSSEQQKGVDETLDKGGLVWYRIANSYGSHYLIIRNKTSSGKYLLLDECVKPESSEKEYSWSELRAQLHGGPGVLQGFICKDPVGDSGSSGGTNTKYKDAKIITENAKKHEKQIRLLNSAEIKPRSGPITAWNEDGNAQWAGNLAGQPRDFEKKILDDFAKKYFKDEMSPGEKAYIALEYINTHTNYGLSNCSGSFIKDIFVNNCGECLQYNSAMAAMLWYLGFDVKIVNGTTAPVKVNTGRNHWWCEIKIGNTDCCIDTWCGGMGNPETETACLCRPWSEQAKVAKNNGHGYYERSKLITGNHSH